MRRGTNVHALGGFNQIVILDTIRRNREGLSRVEIAEHTGLSAQTVSNVSRRLLDDGIIREAGQRILGVGKPRIILQLDPSGGYAIGVHLDPAVITYVVLDLDGRVVAHTATRTPSGVAPERVIAGMRNSIDAIIADAGVDRSRVLGVGIAAPGPLDLEQGVVLDPPLLEGWHGVPLRDALAESTGLMVLLEKDVTAATVAELWMSSGHERDDFMFFYYGTGVGVGLAIAHEAVRGATNNAGDAGHLMVDPDGPVCSCGRRGCLGDAIMPRALVGGALSSGLIAAPTGGLDGVGIDEGLGQLAALAASGDAEASRVLEQMAGRIATAVVTVANLLDLDTVVFGGPYWNLVSPLVLARIAELVNSSDALVTTHPIAVTVSAIGDDVAAVGAACLVLDDVLSPRPSALLIAT
ncbi:ROK family transcriptional regulator [Agromyces sp. ISL-38]|uniref:ROK family transcriptional regulator n=1 Tax=Agromyces sp. ISL-38 TaxID=2819107 RepID=UPI001BE889C7|nr:ROK family transcriptional regulator [Agromyces sp. ISL-38]MBT2499682.1 ROK family transcriptional regulator [Agromyces sp. ISL-38]